jgi:hypothetical protein
MLIQVSDDDWFRVSEIRRVSYYKSRYIEEWTAFAETTEGTRYEKTFGNEEDAAEYCKTLVAKINKEEN